LSYDRGILAGRDCPGDCVQGDFVRFPAGVEHNSLWAEKHPNVFVIILNETQPILIKFGVYCPE